MKTSPFFRCTAIVLLFLLSQNAQGQTTSNLQQPTSVNANGAAPDPSAQLDVNATDKGMLVPRMTTAQRTAINLPATGLLVFDTGTNSFWFFDGIGWADLSANLTDADGDTKIQVEASADEDIVRFGAGGNERLRISKDSSTFEGKVRVVGSLVSGHTDNNAAGPNTHVGGGSFNIALGNSASVSGGDLNTASGSTSFVGGGSNNMAQGNNSFVGGGNENKAINFRDFIGGGFMNTASGGSSFIGGGFLNTAMGQGSFIGGGLGNSAAGTSSFASGEGTTAESFGEAVFGLNNTDYAPFSTTAFEATDRLFVIGNGIDINNRSDALVVLKNGDIGIGTSPSAMLHLRDSASIEVMIEADSDNVDENDQPSLTLAQDGGLTTAQLGYFGGTNDLTLMNNSTIGNGLVLGTNGVERIRIVTSGNVGIGRTPSSNKLEVEGDASKSTAGNWLANSDARLKKNIRPLDSEEILQKMLALQGITYEWDDDQTGSQRPEGTMYGFTAQNIQAVFPELVEEDNLGFLQTAYGTYDAMYVEALRAQQKQIEELQKENKIYGQRLARIEAMIFQNERTVSGD